MSVSYICLGSNLGNSTLFLERAIELINERCGTVSAQSKIYETEPWGFESANKFVNQVVMLETDLAPANLLKQLQAIEYDMGRNTKSSEIKTYADRLIDLDILYYDNHRQHSATLTIPHPFLHERMFVLKPLCDVAPDKVHPVFELTSEQLLKECEDRSEVKEVE